MAAALIAPTVSRPTRLAQRCIERLQLTPPIDVIAVARACDLPIVDLPVGQPDCEAFLAYRPTAGRWAVFTSPSFRDPLRRRFTIAHEVGHFILHRQQIMTAGDAGDLDDPQLEGEAYEFASALLMPEEHVRVQLQLGWLDYEIRRRFQVSMAAWYRRLSDLGHHIHPRFR